MLPAFTTGDVVSGRYKLEAHLGSGATSAVWRARDLDLGRVVALKVLHGAGVDPELAGRFEREGVVLGRLSHPNVVPVFANGTDEGRPYLVMAYIEGPSLDRVLAEGPLPVDEAMALAADVAAGLAAAHAAGVVHRDVKPANIVLSDDGVPHLVDFGIARADDLTAMTRADHVLGTASYLSPEQARGEVPGPATDVYALGCVLHELLTGRPPFTGDTPLAVAYKHVHDDPPRIPRVPDDVEAVVRRALAKDPAERYATGAAFEAALRGSGTEDATQALTIPPAANATMVMPAVAAEVAEVAEPRPEPIEVIDPSPLVEPEPRQRHGWGIAVASCAAAVLVLALLLASLGGNGGGGTPADATDHPPSTTTTVAPTTTTTVLVHVELPKAPKPTPPGHAKKGKKH
jgi:serine/threonine-protein kinase